MNDNLVKFLTGQKAIRVDNADDMKCFVNWLKKYDIYDILVCNRMYYDDYGKISFWRKLVKAYLGHKWIRPDHPLWFTYNYDRVNYFYDMKGLVDEFGECDNITINAKEL